MSFYSFQVQQNLHADLKSVWDFFSSPENLKVITPDYLGFEITSQSLSNKMYPGQIITYKVSPIAGIKLNWMTEITKVQEPYFFVDEQKLGPYKIWHHQHHFEEIEDGVLMTDIVTYALPWFAFGTLGNNLIVKKKLKGIFDHRYKVANMLFNKPTIVKPEAILI